MIIDSEYVICMVSAIDCCIFASNTSSSEICTRNLCKLSCTCVSQSGTGFSCTSFLLTVEHSSFYSRTETVRHADWLGRSSL